MQPIHFTMPLTRMQIAPLLALLLTACASPQSIDPDNEDSAAESRDIAGETDAGDIRLDRQHSGTESLLISIHAIDDQQGWAVGTGGAYVWTDDGGSSWNHGVVPGADSLQFRDVYSPAMDEAYVLSIGPGSASRIYHTSDRGHSWERQFTADHPDTFFNCFAFWNEEAGIAVSDAVDGRFPMIETSDSGAHWSYLENTPAAQENEGGFAASGTCVATSGDKTVVVGTGNAEQARILRSDDGGSTWQTYGVPIVAGEAAGIASLAFRDELRGMALGGDVGDPDAFTDNVARTSDGGRTWEQAERPPFAGAVYGSAFAPDSHLLLAVGPGGAASSHDDGRSWAMLDSLTYWGVDFGSRSSGWMVGPNGRITRITVPQDE